MAIENNLKARLQHAVEYTENTVQYPSDNSVPLKGEVIFSSGLDNFKVGDGQTLYSALTDFLATVATTGSYNDLSNKPTIPQGTFETWTFTLVDNTTITKSVFIGS